MGKSKKKLPGTLYLVTYTKLQLSEVPAVLFIYKGGWDLGTLEKHLRMLQLIHVTPFMTYTVNLSV